MTTTHRTTRRAAFGAVLLLAGALALPAALHAQDAVGPRWRAFTGCWKPLAATGVESTSLDNAPQAPVLCILPGADANTAELVSIVGDSIAERDTVDVTGTALARDRDGCRGDRTATWSADGTRLYLKSHYDCAGLAQSSNELVTLTSDEQLLDIDQTQRGLAKGVRVNRYMPVAASKALPRDLAARLEGKDLPMSLARGAATAPLTDAAIIEASRALDASVVEALLTERGDHFDVDAKHLVALADAGVPGSVTDLMIALAYPKRFAINHAPPALSRADSLRLAGLDRVPRVLLYPSLIGYSSIYDSYYGYRPYGYGYSPYAYSPYGYGYGSFYGYYQPPIVVVPVSPLPARQHGRVVNGRGYTQDGSAGSAGTPQPTRSSGGSSSGSSGGSAASGSSSGGSSSSGETRTAHPKP